MPLAPFSTPFAQILSAAVSRVAAAIGSTTDFVRPVANDRYAVTETEDVFAYLQAFGPMNPRDPGLNYVDSGAGRLFRPVARRIRVYVYTRSGVDSEGGDEVALLGSNPVQNVLTPPVLPGQFVVEELVYNALDDWMPTSAGLPLLITPMHVMDSAGGPPERKPENTEGLYRSMLDFEAVYALAIESTEPRL